MSPLLFIHPQASKAKSPSRRRSERPRAGSDRGSSSDDDSSDDETASDISSKVSHPFSNMQYYSSRMSVFMSVPHFRSMAPTS